MGVPTRCRLTTEIADMVSDADVWAVRNLGRSEGRDVFRSGVAMLWWWEMAPSDRGRGAGTAFLRVVAADLKRRHRGLGILALDPDSPNGKPDFASLEGGAALLPAARRRFRSHVASLDLAGCLGPCGRLVTFDNARRCCMDQQLNLERKLSHFSKITLVVGKAKLIRARNNSKDHLSRNDPCHFGLKTRFWRNLQS